MPLNTPPKDRLAREHVGQLSDIRWQDTESGAVIAQLRDGVVVSGRTDDSGFDIGQQYRFLGSWTEHPKYGPQFKFSTYCVIEPASRFGSIRYLVEHCDGIGEKRAAALYDAYGGEAVKVLRTQPERVVQDGIVTEEVAQQAASALSEMVALEGTKIELHELFGKRGFPVSSLMKAVIRTWGAKAPQAVRKNPFTLMVNGMPGCGFKRCDNLYVELDYDRCALKRQMLSGWHSLRTDGTGHTWFPIEHAVRAINEAIGACAQPQKAVRLGIRARWLRHFRDSAKKLWVAERQKAANEQTVADGIARLMRFGHNKWPVVGELETPSEHQRGKLFAATRGPVGILAGSPGTGKTFSAAALLRKITELYGSDCIAVVAPTGKAAVRCSQAMKANGLNRTATTIHKMLRLGQASFVKNESSQFNENNPLPFRFVVVDEVSMLDTDLAAALVQACADGTHLLLIGDPWQLPPVGHGAPLRDLIAAGVPCGELTEIRRNAGLIVHACAAIKDGRAFQVADRFDAESGQNLRFIERATTADTFETLQDILLRFQTTGTFHPVWSTQVIVGVNDKGELNRRALNDCLQTMLNPDGRRAPPNPFRTGDKVICLKNGKLPATALSTDIGAEPWCVASYQAVREPFSAQGKEVYVANGEIGRVEAVTENVVVARFSEADDCVKFVVGRQKEDGDGDESGAADKGRGCNFDLGYAVTCHKMQGSEAPCVIALADKNAGAVASREWWYTAISRATKLCIVIGPREVMDRQAKRVSLKRRKTFLTELTKANLEQKKEASCPQ